MEELKMAEAKSKSTKSKTSKSKETKNSETKSKVTVSKESKKVFNETVTAVWIDKLLDRLRKGYFSDFLGKNEKWLVAAGLFGLYLSAILGLLTSFVLPMRYEDISYGPTIGLGVIWFFLCIVIHYIAFKFLPALSNIVKNTPTPAFIQIVSGCSGSARRYRRGAVSARWIVPVDKNIFL